MLWFRHTKGLLEDVKDSLSTGQLPVDSPIINDYMVKLSIMLYSSEMENDLKELFSRKLAGHKHFCQLCNKLRNPKVSDINSALKDLSLPTLSLPDDTTSKYSNLIIARDKIAHIPDYSIQLSIDDVQDCVTIGTVILQQIETITI